MWFRAGASAPADVTWKLTSGGNTSAAYAIKEYLKGNGSSARPPKSRGCQLILGTGFTPTRLRALGANGRKPVVTTTNIVSANIPNPGFTQAGSLGSNDPTVPGLGLGAGESGPSPCAPISTGRADADTKSNVANNIKPNRYFPNREHEGRGQWHYDAAGYAVTDHHRR